MGTFKQWLLMQELALGSDGVRDNASTQTSQDTAKVAQGWLAEPKNSVDQANLVNTGASNRSKLPKLLFNAGAEAIKQAPPRMGQNTTSNMVANFLQNSFQLPNVIKPPKPGKIGI
jgi:hypothetical protein